MMKWYHWLSAFTWELPQNLVGWFLRVIYKGEKKAEVDGIAVYYLESFGGGISLGNTIIVSSKRPFAVRHEYGHRIQSRYLGPLYLLVIGIPSIIWAGIHSSKWYDRDKRSYYDFYTERWANKLGGVE